MGFEVSAELGSTRRLPGRRFAAIREAARSVAFIAPAVTALTVFSVVPFAHVIYYSLTEWDGLAPAKWVGLQNYAYLLDSADYHRVVLTTVLLVCGIVVWVAVPFTMALIVFGLRRADLVRTVLFIPVLLPPVVVGGVFTLLLGDQGPLNSMLGKMGLGFAALPWLTNDKLVLATVVGVIAWATMGSGVLFYSAGLAAIPTSYVEAAQIDGANWRQLVWFIYRPGLRPVTRFWVLVLTISTVSYFFPWIFGLTQGGPGMATTTMDYDVYVTGISYGQWGLASAMAVVAIVLVVTLLLLQVLGRRLRRDL